MKVLMLTPYLPYPLLTGGQTRSYNLIKRLSSLGHNISLFCLVKNEKEKEYVSELEKYCREVRVFKRAEKPWTLTNILRTAFSVYPFLVIRNWAGGEKKAIEKTLNTEEFDLIHAETFYVMPHIPQTQIPILLVEQTIEYLVYKHFVDEFKILPIKPLLYSDVSKLKFWEKKFWSKATKVVAMSEDDRKTMKHQLPNLDVDIVPNGVDVDFFNEQVLSSGNKNIRKPSNKPIILYLGNFTWLQNREAVKVLIDEIWPIIKGRIPKSSLWIIGKDAKNFFKNLESEDIRVDEVEDVREVYQAATVLVAPIYGGGGTRYKNFEAFASGLPVVTTHIGIGGTEARDGVDVIIRDDPEGIAIAAINLIENSKLSKNIAENAKKMVSGKYNWDKISQQLSNIYMELGRRK